MCGEAGAGVRDREGGSPCHRHLHRNGSHAIHPAVPPLPRAPVKHQRALGSAPQPRTWASPAAATARPQPRCTRTHPPSTVCLGSQPPTCHGAVPPPHPLLPVSGRQLQLCPLLSEQVDSDAQSHKPWVGMSFFFCASPFCLLPLLPCPLPSLSPFCPCLPRFPLYLYLLCSAPPKFPM